MRKTPDNLLIFECYLLLFDVLLDTQWMVLAAMGIIL